MAWLAMIAAEVAMITPGITNHCGIRSKSALMPIGPYFFSNGKSGMVVQEVSALSQVVEQQAGFYKDPGHADVGPAAVTKVAVECFGTGGTQKNSTQQP
jgi:hypothetical protein